MITTINEWKKHIFENINKDDYKVIMYVTYMGPDTNFQPGRKYFYGDDYMTVYDEAVKWCKETMDKFDPDYIKLEKNEE